MVAPRSAPHSSSAAITASAEALPAVLRGDLDAAEADPVVGVRRDPAGPVADPDGRPRRPSSSYSTGGRGATEPASRPPRAGGRHPGDLEQRVRVVALQDPAVAAEERVLGGVRQHRRDRPAGALGVERDDPLVVVGDAGRPDREHRVGAPGGRGGGVPQDPVAERLGLQVRPQRQRAPLRLGRGRPGAGSAAAAGPACRTRCRRSRSRPSGPSSGCTTQVPSAHDRQMPSTSVSAGPPLGPVSPGSTRRTTTRCPTTCGPSMCLVTSWGRSLCGTPGILGCASSTCSREFQEESVTYVISQPCVDLKDRACVDECPVDCIYEGKRMLYIHPDECVDCGACEPVCPVEAIFYEDDIPEQWKDYYEANVALLRRPRLARWRRQDGRDRPRPPDDRRAPAAGNQRALSVSARLPDFPWDRLLADGGAGAAHPDGIVDLSIGTPVDPTPAVVQDALRAAADSPGYPLTIGRVETRQACVDWLARRHGVTGLGLDGVLPVIGSKELIASMAGHLGLGAGDLIAYPELAYPTYEVGAALAGARAVATDSLTSFGPETPGAALAELAVEPDRPGAARRAPAQGRRLVPRARHDPGLRRVLPRVRLGGRAAVGAAPRRLRRLPRGDPRGPLALEALQPGRLPVRVRRRRPGAGRRAARRTQEPRPADARPAAGRDDRRARRRRARRRAARPLRRPPRQAARGARVRRASGSTTPRRRSTSGRPATRTAGTPSPGSPTAASWSRPARSTAGPAAGTSGWRSPPPTSASTPRVARLT